MDLELKLLNLDNFSSRQNDHTMSFSNSFAVNFLVEGHSEPAVSLINKDWRNEFSILVNNMRVEA